MTDAVIYCRISRDRAGAGLGVARQEKDCRELCDRLGWTVSEVIVENDLSAYSGKRRPGYERLLEGLRERRWQAVVAWHPDRLHRQPKELESFIDAINEGKAEIATVMAGAIDLATASGRMAARLHGTVARHESEQKSERIRRKHQELAEAGAPSGGGGRAFGYLEDRVTPHPIEAPLVAEAARSLLDGVPLRGIVRDWQARGVPTVTGAPWTSYVLRRMLLSPRVAGFREHGGKLYKAQWPAIVDEMTWRRVRALLQDPSRRVNQSPRAYLLTGGLAVCGLCDANLVARPRGDKRRSYVCASGPGFHGCGKIRALADTLEQHILSVVTDRLTDAVLPAPEADEVPGLLDQIEAAEARLSELADDYYAHRTVTRAQFQSASAKITAQLGDLRTAAATAETRPALDADAAEVLLGDDMHRKRGIVAALVERVVVGPAVKGRNVYDPSRIRVDWL